MATSLWKFIKSKVAHQDRSKIAELLAFSKGATTGFPECPTSLAVDPQLSLLAIGTALGAVHIYGAPGVELLFEDEKRSSIKHLIFIINTGRIVVIHETGVVTLLELNTKDDVTVLENVKSIHSAKLEKVSTGAVVATSTGPVLLAATTDGEILAWSLPLLEAITSIDGLSNIREALASHGEATNLSDEKKASPGSVVSLVQRPKNATLLVAFSSGIIALYDIERKVIEHVVYHEQGLTNVSWQSNGDSFNSSYDDGTYIIWNINGQDVIATGKPSIPYGPYPCLPMQKIIVHSPASAAPPTIIFSGGLPCDRFAEHHSISIYEGEKHTALDFSSQIVDFVILENEAVPSEPHTLIVLLQNQLVTIDLTNEKYPEIVAPHLMYLFTPVTSFELFEDVPEDLIRQLQDVGKKPSDVRPFGGYIPKYSQREWPIHGGTGLLKAADVSQQNLLITAHGDGCLRFWDASGLQLSFLHKLDAPSRYYHVESDVEYHDDSFDVWPPFRKYGFVEEAVSDPRLQIQKFAFDPATKTLAVGGKAGQVLVYQLNNECAIVNFQTLKVQLVGEEFEYVWRGTQALPHHDGNLDLRLGFQGVLNVQLDPPSEITALQIQSEWELMAIGTGHGFAVVDYVRHRQILSNCTLNPTEGTDAHETVQQKAKRAGDTLRRSLRRIPRPHLNIRSPTSYTFSSHENGVDSGKPSKLIEEVELKGERQIASPVEEVKATNGTDALVNGQHGDVPIHTVITEKMVTFAEDGTETVETKKEILEVVAAVPFEKSTNIIVSPTKIEPDLSGQPSGSIIVDEAILQSLEKDIMPPGLEEEEKKDAVKPEKVYNYESTTVRSVTFANSFILNESTSSPCVWVGQNNGTILAFTLELPPADTKMESVKAVLSKEIHLRHGAPVIFMGMLDDGALKPVESTPASPVPSVSASPALDEVAPPVSPSAPSIASKLNGLSAQTSSQKLLVASEEQLKIFHLPSLKPYGKYKLSNARFKKVDIVQVDLLKDEYYVTALNTRGEVDVFSIPSLKRRLRSSLAKKDNLNVAFGRNGHGIYQSGTNELQRFFLVGGVPHNVSCLIHLPEGARPLPPPPVSTDEVVVEKLEQTETQELVTAKKEDDQSGPSLVSPVDVSSPTIETVELQESPLKSVVVQEMNIITVTEEEKIVVSGEDAALITIHHTVQTVTVPTTDGETIGDDTLATKTLCMEEVTVDVEPLNDSILADDLAELDMSSDSVIDHNTKTNGYNEEADHVVHSMEEKLKAMEEDGAHVSGEMETY